MCIPGNRLTLKYTTSTRQIVAAADIGPDSHEKYCEPQKILEKSGELGVSVVKEEIKQGFPGHFHVDARGRRSCFLGRLIMIHGISFQHVESSGEVSRFTNMAGQQCFKINDVL